MKKILVSVACAVSIACALSACDRAKSGAQVAKDTNAAEEKAAENIDRSERDATHVAAVQNQQMADTEAEGAYRVALAQCEALSGVAQKSCRDQADANYQLAKASAKQERAESDPKP
jgi:hypothetical protein